jgi:outer membrane protein assembly factor BamB
VSALTGEEIASVDTDRLVSAIGFIDHDLVWGDELGNVVRYDLEKRSIYWKFRNGAKISSLTTANEAVLAASYDNFVYLIHPYFGSVKWKKRLAGRASDVVIGDPLFAVALAVGEPTAILLNLENGKPVGQVNVGMDESFLTQPIYADGKYIFFTNRQVFVQSTAPCSTK